MLGYNPTIGEGNIVSTDCIQWPHTVFIHHHWTPEGRWITPRAAVHSSKW